MRKETSHATSQEKPTLAQRFGNYIQDPLGSIVTASAATIGSFGIVISGSWLISLAVS